MSVVISPADPLGDQALALLAEAVHEANQRYPELVVPGAPPPTNAPLVPRASFVLAAFDGAVVGCGALRPLDERTAEIKRMFVRRAARRQGVARAILAHLLVDARASGTGGQCHSGWQCHWQWQWPHAKAVPADTT